MSVEVIHKFARIFYMAAGIFSGIAILLFFRFRIWKIIGDLSGTNKKRGIKEIEKQERIWKQNSQGLLGWKSSQAEDTEVLNLAGDTGVLEERMEGKYCLLKKMEYIGSEVWIE